MIINKSVEHFVTLFDSKFLPQGLALHASLERCMKESYRLWILCLDDEVYRQLNIIALNNVLPLKLSELESEELLAVKKTRTLREYCWTLTPFAPSFVFQADKTVERVTYLDADTWFLKDPKNLFLELGESDKLVLITEHAYSPEHDQTESSGRYCVQFITFVRAGGEEVMIWWQERCLEWCYARHEDGKFGDQKYLEKFPELFKDKVHIAQNLNNFMAPWNATRFPYNDSIIWHFHGLRIIKLFGALRVYFGDYYLPSEVLQKIYMPYIQDILSSMKILKSNGFVMPIQATFNWKKKIKYFSGKYLLLKGYFLLQNLTRL